MRTQDNKYVFILLSVCFFSLIIFLGNALFNTKGEPREAIVAVSMLKYGNWILPVNNGVDIAYKPPFFHWCIAFFSLLAGHVSEFTSRLPSALSLTAMVLVAFKFYAKRRSPQLALLTCLITLTSFEVHRAGTNCRVDMVLCSLTVISLFQLYKWREKGLRGIPLTAILCMSGAFLTKGPVGIILPCLVAFAYMWIRGERFVRLLCVFALTALGACVLPACWYVAAYMQGGETFLQLVYEENVLRFLGKMTYSSHEAPFYYNFITVIAGYVPYTLLALISLFALGYKKPAGTPRNLWSKLRDYVRNMDDARLFSLLSITIIFIFYCIPKSKRSVYLLPIYPFIAYFLAEYVIYLAKHHRNVIRSFGYTLSVLSVLLVATLSSVRMRLIPESIFSGRHADENIAFMDALADTQLGAVQLTAIAMPLVAAVIFWLYRRKSLQAQVYSMLGIIFAIFFSLDGFYNPTVLNVKSDKPVALRIKEIAGDRLIYSYDPNVVEGNPLRQFSVNFYLNDNVMPFEAATPESGYVLAGDDVMSTFKKEYPEYKVTEVEDFNHKSCDNKKMLHLYMVEKTMKRTPTRILQR